jgi:hypothetical protein
MQALQFSRTIEDYSPFRLRSLFLRRFLAAYFSLALLGAGVGLSQDKNQFSLQTAPEALAQGVDFSLSQQPVLQHYQTLPFSLILNNAVDNKASGNFNPSNFKIPTKQEMYSSYLNAAVALAKGDEQSRQKSVDYLIKAMELDPDRAFPQAAASPPAANDAPEVILAETKVPQAARNLDFLLSAPFPEPLVQVYQTLPWNMMPNAIGKDAKPATETKKHSNTIWWIIGGIAAAVGGYLIYKAVTKKTPTPVPPNPDYTVTFNVFNQTLGKQKTFTRTGKAGASVSISSADWSDVANINPKFWVLREDGFGNYVTDASDSSKTWSGTIPVNGITYEIYGANSTNNAPYDKLYIAQYPTWGTLKFARNTKWRFIQGNQDGSKDTWAAAINQIRTAIRPSWGKPYGELTDVDTGEDLNVKFNSLGGILGDRVDANPMRLTVDLAECAKRNIPPIRICIEESVEGLGSFDDIADIGDHSSYLLITDANGLNALGADLVSWVYAKDQKAGTVSSSLNASGIMTNMFASTLPKGSQGVSVGSFKLPGRSGKATLRDIVAMLPDMQVQQGKFGIALNPAMGRMQLGLGDEKAGVATTLTNNGYGPADFTAAAQVQRGVLTAGAQYSTSSRNLQAGVGTKLGDVQVSVYGSFDASRKVNTFNFGFSPVPGVVFGYGNSGKYHVINASANLGGKVIVDSSANIAPDDLDFALRVSAMLDRAVVYGVYDQSVKDGFRKSSGQVALNFPVWIGYLNAVCFFGPGINGFVSGSAELRIAFSIWRSF